MSDRRPDSGARPAFARPIAKPREFIEKRTRLARYDEERTRFECLYAIYRRWAFLSDMTAASAKNFEAELRKTCPGEPYEMRGDRVYPRFVIDPPVKEDDDEVFEAPPAKPRVLGQVRVVEDMKFVDGQCVVGTVLPWMEATPYEKQNLDRLSKTSVSEPGRSHLIVVWKDKRRTISGRSVERV